MSRFSTIWRGALDRRPHPDAQAEGGAEIETAWWPSGNFSAIYLILQDPGIARADFSWLRAYYPLTQAATAAVIVFVYSTALMILAAFVRATTWKRLEPARALLGRIPLRSAWIGAGSHCTWGWRRR